MILVACPGQGSQTPGFLEAWIESDDNRTYLEKLSDAAGVDLITHGSVSDADTIKDTAVAQPLIVAASLLSWRSLSAQADTSAVSVAGHSVGEFAAAAIAGVISDVEAMQLVAVRGQAMAAAAALEETGMAAVVGGEEAEVVAAIASAGLTPANMNGAGQIVAAGAKQELQAFVQNPPAGTRVIPLQVAGAFHTQFMTPAVETLQARVASIAPAKPALPLYSNNDGSKVSDGARFTELLVSQVSNPVRWDACMNSFLRDGISGFIELLPGGALTGIAKRAMKGVPAVAIKSPEDIGSAAELIG